MVSASTLDSLAAAMVDLEDEQAEQTARGLLESGIEPVEILTACEKALAVIGEKYASGEYYISGLIMAGEIMTNITALATPYLSSTPDTRDVRGRVLIGTVEGDIHDLGKNIAGALLAAHGFQVHDLGVDVPAEDFVRVCREFKPDIVGLSVLLGTCFASLGDTVEALKDYRDETGNPVIFISGSQVNENIRKRYGGADYYVPTAYETVMLCENICAKKGQTD